MLQYLNDIDASKAGNILSDSMNLDGKEETSNRVQKISNPITSNFVQSKYLMDTNTSTSDAWICRTCGRSNKLAKDRCATCKQRNSLPRNPRSAMFFYHLKNLLFERRVYDKKIEIRV